MSTIDPLDAHRDWSSESKKEEIEFDQLFFLTLKVVLISPFNLTVFTSLHELLSENIKTFSVEAVSEVSQESNVQVVTYLRQKNLNKKVKRIKKHNTTSLG